MSRLKKKSDRIQCLTSLIEWLTNIRVQSSRTVRLKISHSGQPLLEMNHTVMVRQPLYGVVTIFENKHGYLKTTVPAGLATVQDF